MHSDYSDKFRSQIKQFKLNDFLMLIAEINKNIYSNQREDSNAKPFVKDQIKTDHYVATSNPIMPWNLAKLSWLGILFSNDHKRKIPTKNDITFLNELLLKEDNVIYDKKKEPHSVGSNIDSKLMLTHGLTQEQIWLQDGTGPSDYKYNFLRYYLIINKMSKSLAKRHKYDPNIILKTITGFNIEEFSTLIFVLWNYSYSCQSKIVFDNFDNEITREFPIVTPTNLIKVSEMISENYEYYRKQHHHNPLITKPIVRTQNNESIIANTYLLTIRSCEAVYWQLKDDNPDKFGSLFGYYYENYIRNVLEYYLATGQFKKISDNDETQADWKIESTNFVLLIEQKSATMPIGLKRFYTNPKMLEKYISKNFTKKGFPQLKNTADKLKKSTKKQIIKLILHFEKFYLKEYSMKPYVNKSLGWNTKRYYFIDTVEFEQIIQLLSKNEKKFNEVINKKIEYEDSGSMSFSKGTDFYHILKDLNCFSKVDFLEKESQSFKFFNL